LVEANEVFRIKGVVNNRGFRNGIMGHVGFVKVKIPCFMNEIGGILNGWFLPMKD